MAMHHRALGSSTLSVKGQVVIPVEVRRKLHLDPGANIVFVVGEDGRIYLELKESLQIEQQTESLKSGKLLLKKMNEKFKGQNKINAIKDLRDDGD